MNFSIFLSSLGFVGFFLWYLAAENAPTRRAAGLGSIIASLLTCGLALFPLDKAIHLGLDLQGGTEFLLEVQGKPDSQALDQAISVIRKRLDIFGTREISIQPEGKDRLKIQIPGLQGAEVDKTKKYCPRPPSSSSNSCRLTPRKSSPPRWRTAASCLINTRSITTILPQVEKDAQGKDVVGEIVVERKVQMSGKHVSAASRGIEQSGQSVVNLEFDDEGKQQFADVTTKNVGRQLAIVLDHEVRSAPNLDEPIPDGRADFRRQHVRARMRGARQRPAESARK